MGSSVCSRRQKRIFQTLLFLTVAFGFLYGLLLYYEMHSQLKKAENVSSKYQQHQEALSAQLQVVYEHRSRLEKSLQKERNEHKKAKEDFLVYKLEAQEALNKEKDTSNRYSSLTIQHKMLKNQHEELKRQYSDLHVEHQRLGDDHNKAINEHSHRYLGLQQVKEQEIAKLKENIYNLLDENKKLRKAHQDVHVQLQDTRQQHKNLLLQHDQLQLTLEDHKNSLSAAQVQMEEYKQLKDTLNKMASLGTKRVQNAPYPHADQTQQRDEEPKRTLYGTDNTESMENRRQVDAQLEMKPVGENDDTKTSQAQDEDHHQENWSRNNQLGETAQREEDEVRQAGQAEWPGHQPHEDVDTVKKNEQPDREDQGMEHLEKQQQQSKEEEDIKDDDYGHEHTDQDNNHLSRNEPNEIERKRHKSPYEEQLEQQKLAKVRAEEAQKLKERQEAVHQQRLKEYMERQQYLRQRERELQEEAERKELLLRQEQLRQESEFQNEDVPEAEDEQDVREEEEEEEVDDENNPREEPEDVVNEDHRPEQEAMEQQIAGNPDQQEDNLDDQYQDEGEEEVQEDLIEEAKKVEENVEGPYTDNENAEEKEGELDEQDEAAAADDARLDEGEKEDENYEEEEDAAEVPAVKMRRRGEM